MKRFLLLSAVLLAAAPVFADETPQTSVVGPFGGLNTNVRREALPASASQDLLNVDVTPGGRSVKKREGFGLDVSLTFSSSPAHNLYTFFDTSGNQVRLAFNDRNVNASVNGSAWSVILTTGITTGATWDCTDYLGQAYCVSSAFDCPIITNGTSAGTTCNTNIPAGTLVASTGDRLLIGGTSANPSRISYSQSTIFTNFTLGTQNSSPSFEDINSPGSKLTHLAYHYGRWLWWKDQSFGFIVGTGQLDLQIVTVSNTIGTFDNTDVYDQGLTYFRGSDSQIYIYDGSNLTRTFSTDIAPTLRTASRRRANSWSQTTQSDFQAGSITTNGPSSSLSTTILPGDIVPSSITIVDASSTNFNLGSVPTDIDTTTVVNKLTLKTYLSDQFSSMSNWNQRCGTVNASGNDADFTSASHAFEQTASSSPTGNMLYQFDFKETDAVPQNENLQAAVLNTSLFGYVTYIKASTSANKYIIYLSSSSSGSGVWNDGQATCNSPGISEPTNTIAGLISSGTITYDNNWHTLKFIRTNSTNLLQLYIDGNLLASVTNTAFSSFSKPYIVAQQAPGVGHFHMRSYYFTASAGNFNSRAFDTAFSTPIYGTFTSSTNAQGTISYAVRCSSNSATTYTSDSSITSGSIVTTCANKRYLVYSTTMTTTDPTLLPQISSVTLIAASTGTFYSAVNNAAQLSSWNEFTATDANPGTASITYYTRASTNNFTVLSTTPTWVLQSKNSTVSASTGTYFQAREDFSMSVTTDVPDLSDFQFNWFEGMAADKMYATYFNNAIWFSLNLGTTTTTNNRILRYDLLAQAWTLYDIPANGFLTYNNFLYFGGSSTGCVFQYGNSVTSDNGSAINSYWKSKDFFGVSPFQDEDLRMSSWYAKSSSGTILSITYQVNESTQTTYSFNLFDPKASISRHTRNFLAGSMYNTINWKFGDNSANPAWEVFAGQWIYVPRSLSVYP